MKQVITGLRAWMVQRVTAVVMLLFIIFFLTHQLLAPAHSYAQWQAWMLSPAVSIAAFVFFAALFAHIWVGLRDVILDYIKPLTVRILVLAVLGLILVALSGWVIRILLLTHG